MKKLNNEQEKLRALNKELMESGISRRDYLKYLLVGGATLAAGIALGRFLFPQEKRETVTKEETITLTTTKTLTERTTYTTTEKTTTTTTLYSAKLENADFIKLYSPKGLEILARLRFNDRAEVDEASLELKGSEIFLTLKEKERNLYEGKIFLEEPKPYDYLIVWDAKTKEGVIASKILPEKDRRLTLLMPLRKEEYESFDEKIILDELFRNSIYIYSTDPEKAFLQSYKILNETRKRPKRKETLQALTYYSLAIISGLPYNAQAASLFLDANEINPTISDFTPIVITDAKNQTYTIGSKDIPRDCWMIAEHLKRTPDVINYPEMFEALNIKVQQNAFDILDNPRMREYFNEYYKPTDEIIWEKVIIPQWQYHWNSTPQAGNVSKICVLPWYNSALLKEWISNETDRKIALMYFWELPTELADLDAYLRKYNIIHHNGLDAMQYLILQMPRVYEEVISKYPNDLYHNPITKEDMDYRVHYYGWINDRADHGLYNAGKQFLGVDINEIPFNEHLKDIDASMLQYDSINTYLSKNFTHWDLIKFIYGYGIEYGGGDSQMDLLYYPIAFKAFGIPYNLTHYFEHYINAPARYVGGYDGGIIGLPDSIIKPLKEGKYGEVLIPPGNLIDPLSIGLDGIRKDLEYGKQNPIEPNLKYIENYLKLRGSKIVFFSDGRKG
ncbi:MAG: hypothetical protein QXY18_00225 [Nitrososphaerota archaeon]